MSTIGYKDWGVDMADVGAIYPFQGWEVAMTVVGVAFWIGWHIIQFRSESAELEAARKSGDPEAIKKAIDRY